MAQTRSIIIFALGPVQSFITTARRTQDLAAGSQLLSQLARTAMKAAITQGAQPVFPVVTAGKLPKSVPNRMVVIANANGKAMAQVMEKAARDEWKHIADKVLDEFERLVGNGDWKDRWHKQVEEWLEVYWVSSPWDGINYGEAYRRASLALDARKNLRFYPTSPQSGEKCTLCGTQSALGDKSFWERARGRPGGSRIRPDERLSAISTIKRFAPWASIKELDVERFPSTSSIASASFRAAVLKSWDDEKDGKILGKVALAHLDAVDELGLKPYHDVEPSRYLQKLAANDSHRRFLKYDGDYFYSGLFTEEQIKEALGVSQISPQERESLGKVSQTLRELRKLVGVSPSAYYAVVALDGDNMGRLLDNAKSPEAHQNISQALAALADGPMRRIVEEDYPGQLIYAGGDDALAFLPVDCAMTVADKLRQAFEDALKRAGQTGRTASVGIAITHHLQPLEGALREAREAEQAAKSVKDKNALAVRVLKRSGAPRQVIREWANNSMQDDPIEEVRRRIAEGQLSGKFAYDVDAEADALSSIAHAHGPELERLLKRHRDPEKWREANECQSLAARLAEFTDALPEREGAKGLAQAAQWLIVARFLAQGDGE